MVGAADICRRPVVVFSSDAAIPWLRGMLVGSCTTNIRGLPRPIRATIPFRSQ